MDEPDAPPRLRWRLLGWLFAAILLLPVLYVAMSGPLTWWNRYHYHAPQWNSAYWQTLTPPRVDYPQIDYWMFRYTQWWDQLPALRSWRRQYLADQLAAHRMDLEYRHADIKQWQAGASPLQQRLNALDSRVQLTPEESDEASYLRRALEGFRDELDRRVRDEIRGLEDHIRAEEDALREFEAAKH